MYNGSIRRPYYKTVSCMSTSTNYQTRMTAKKGHIAEIEPCSLSRRHCRGATADCNGPIHWYKLEDGHLTYYAHLCVWHRRVGWERIRHENDICSPKSGCTVVSEGHTNGLCLTCQFWEDSGDEDELN